MATILLNQSAPTERRITANPPSVSFVPFELPKRNQRQLGAPHAPGLVSPLALRPDEEDISLDKVIDTVKSLQAKGGILTQKLATHGALLFRDLPITSANDFSKFAHAFGYNPHEIIGIVVDRPLLAPNVAPANEAPKEVLIYNHNESPQVPHAPEYIFFYGHKVAKKGGETPVSSSLELFQRAKEEIPEFVDELVEKGIRSRVTYKVQAQYKGGSTLKQAFGKEILEGDDQVTRRAKVEAQILRYGRGEHTTWEWTNDSTLVVTHQLPAIRRQSGTDLPTLFTGLAALYKNALINGNGGRKGVTQQTFGDGSEIPVKYLKLLADITDDIRVLHRWQQGDVLVYDNVIAQHGREPWEGEQDDRIIMASLFDGDKVPGAYNAKDWAQVVQALDSSSKHSEHSRSELS